MSDNPYHALRNQYAQGAIRAVSLVNGAAAVALLSQIAALRDFGLTASVAYALGAYLCGILLGLMCWITGFKSTALGGFGFDAAERIREDPPKNATESEILKHMPRLYNGRANRWAIAGFVLFSLSALSFLIGSGIVLYDYWSVLHAGAP